MENSFCFDTVCIDIFKMVYALSSTLKFLKFLRAMTFALVIKSYCRN